MRPSRESALAEYFEHESEKIRNNLPGLSNATYRCVCFFAHSVNTADIVATFDEEGNIVDNPPWYEQQKAIVDQWQSTESIQQEISFRISDCGLEEYEELWSIGEGDHFNYISPQAFLAEVDWEYLMKVAKNCWRLVSMNS